MIFSYLHREESQLRVKYARFSSQANLSQRTIEVISPCSPLYSSREKMVDKDNCPIFEAWADGNRQAIST